MKEVLVIYYSQSGQLTEIVNNIVQPLERDENINVKYHEIEPDPAFDFPWEEEKFYDTFPETFHQVPYALKPIAPDVLNKKYDLIILGYQIWFLTPSIPVNSFLESPEGQQLVRDTPVVTVIGCRNMWAMAQEKTKKLLAAANARLVGNIVLADRHINHVSVITIAHWMFSGTKTRYLGIFPKPGVSEKDIREAVKFGSPIREALRANDFTQLQNKLLRLEAVTIKPFLITVDRRANLLFSKWANLIAKKGNPGDPKRLKWTKLFKYYLLFAIWVIAPIVFIIFLLTYLPSIWKIRKEKAYYSSVDLI